MRPAIFTMYQAGTTDGYKSTYGSTLYHSREIAEIRGSEQGYGASPREVKCVEIEGAFYIVEGPYETAKQVARRQEVREAALAKLTPEERAALGLEDSDGK